MSERSALPITRATTTSARGRIALGGLVLTGALVSLSAAHTAPLLPESIRPAPRWLAGPFGGLGLDLHVVGTIAVLVLMFGSYLAAITCTREISARTLVAAIAVLHVCVLLAPPLISTDVFSYQAYARMGADYGVNPYLHGPAAIALDPVFPYVGAKWSSFPSAYGPVFTALSYLLAPLTVAASVGAYKSIATVASLSLVALVWHGARQRGTDPVRAIALVGLNPLLVVYGVGGGHNDLLMLVALAGSLCALLAGRERTGGALAVLAAGVKLTAAIVLPFALAAPRPQQATARRRDLLLGAAAAAGLVAALSFTLFGSGALHMFATVRQSQSEGDWKSIPGAIGQRLGLPAVADAVSVLLVVAFAGVCLGLLVAVWRGTLDWIDGAGWATFAMLVASTSLLPWYVGWLLPLSALGRDRRLARVAVAMTGVVLGIQLLGYIPHG